MSNKYINSKLADEIDEKIAYLGNFDSYHLSSSCHKRRMKSIKKNAQVHSFRIENPNTGIPFCVPRNKNKGMIKEGIKNIRKASEWAKNNFDAEKIGDEFLKEIAGRVCPEYFDGSADYRKISPNTNGGSTIQGASVTPPDAEKVAIFEMPWFFNSLRGQLRSEDPISRIETAIFSHLHTARIHPFYDGNGRTARTLQDTILDASGIPVPIIESGERMFYFDVLDNAVYGWKHEGGKEMGIVSEGESRFYNYIAGKVNVSLDHIIDNCRHSH